MKTKYSRLNKEEKKSVIKEYKSTTKHLNQYNRLMRLIVIGIICLCFSIFILIYNLLNTAKWYEYISIVALIVSGVLFILVGIKVRLEALNKVAISRK